MQVSVTQWTTQRCELALLSLQVYFLLLLFAFVFQPYQLTASKDRRQKEYNTAIYVGSQ